MRILPAGPKEPLLTRIKAEIGRALNPPATELEFMAAVVTEERLGRTARAIKLCENGLRRFPNDYYLLMKRQAQAREAGDRACAEAMLNRAAPLCPETAATLSSVGEEFAMLGQMSTAVEYFRRAILRGTANALIQEKLAMALVAQRRMDEGIEELSAALAAEPGNTERRELLFKVLLQAERYQEIVDLARAQPDGSLGWECLMCLTMALGRLAEKDPFAEPEASSADVNAPNLKPNLTLQTDITSPGSEILGAETGSHEFD